MILNLPIQARAGILAAVLALLAASPPAHAAAVPKTWDFEIFAGTYDLGARELDDDTTLGVRFGRNLTRRFGWEAELALFDTEGHVPADQRLEALFEYNTAYLDLSAVAMFFPAKRVVPSLFGGAGIASVSVDGFLGGEYESAPDGLTDDSLTLNAGGALKIELTQKLYLRPEWRVRWFESRADDPLDQEITLSLGFRTEF